MVKHIQAEGVTKRTGHLDKHYRYKAITIHRSLYPEPIIAAMKIIIILILTLLTTTAHADILATQYVDIYYDGRRQLDLFNEACHFKEAPEKETWDQTTVAKIDAIVDKVQAILAMHSTKFRCKIVILSHASDIHRMHEILYWSKPLDSRAFYSAKNNTIFLSEECLQLKVVAHELAHAVIENYYGKYKTPKPAHEALAKFVHNTITQ